MKKGTVIYVSERVDRLPVFHEVVDTITVGMTRFHKTKCGCILLVSNCVWPSKKTADNMALDGVDCRRCYPGVK